ncbi:MAG TPA: transketolase family protein [Leptospiraceae bacterium]|nr:transketolase family protein [Leptospiraceae bacterium]
MAARKKKAARKPVKVATKSRGKPASKKPAKKAGVAKGQSAKAAPVVEVVKKATRDGYGEALAELGKTRPEVVVLDADLSESTRTHKFARAYPDRFFNVGVAEQNLVGMAAGLSLSGLVPFASSFAMFLSGRAWEIVRNSVAYPGLNVKLVASHGGITVGEDGASHQCIEDFAVMRAIPKMRVFVPSDFTEAKQMIAAVAAMKGPCYIRVSRAATPVLSRPPSYKFQEGKGELRRDGKDVTIIACGVMVAEADLAAEKLAKQGIQAAVINMASIKPIDEKLVLAYAKKTGAIVTSEEHNVIGGLGSAVAEVISENQPCVVLRNGMQDEFGQSGEAGALMDFFKMRSDDLVRMCKKAISLKKR